MAARVDQIPATGLRPSTVKSYRNHIRLDPEPSLGLIPLTELNTHHLIVMYKALARRPTARDHTRCPQPLSCATTPGCARH